MTVCSSCVLNTSLFQIEGMTCSSCVHLIERTLLSNKGVEKAVVALATTRGHVEFDPTVLGPRDIIRIIEVSQIICNH